MIGAQTEDQARGPTADLRENLGTCRVMVFDLLEGELPLVVPIIHLKQRKGRGPTTFTTQLGDEVNLVRECRVLLKAFSTRTQRAGRDQLKNARPRAFHCASNRQDFNFIGKGSRHWITGNRSMPQNS